jgi:protein-tyrosine phosphatase
MACGRVSSPKRLAFGNAVASWRHVERLQALGITHVINLRHRRHNRKVRQFRALWLPFRDDKAARSAWFYRRALRFYQRAMRRPGSKVFVMCHHGICRSASLAYFLLRASHRSAGKAKGLVLGARPSAHFARAYCESAEQFLRRRRK